jgi:hypothetical protein
MKMGTAVVSGLAVMLFLRYGLEPLGWLFYEASFALGIDALYWGYSIFRGAGYAFSLWSYQWLACALVGGLTALLLMRRA